MIGRSSQNKYGPGRVVSGWIINQKLKTKCFLKALDPTFFTIFLYQSFQVCNRGNENTAAAVRLSTFFHLNSTISTDLITEILLRLPVKSIARCRCVSKLWNSTLRDPLFTELFLTMSSARPRLLFSLVEDRELCFFSAPQGESSSTVAADYHLQFTLDDSYKVCGHVRGLVCLADQETAHVICCPGSVHDARVLSYAMERDSTFPTPPPSKYYLVDSGYANTRGYLAPFRGHRYHLPHFQVGSPPRDEEELFNRWHSSLRSVIERTFGVWKKKWRILSEFPRYDLDTQNDIIIATAGLHNFIRLSQIPDLMMLYMLTQFQENNLITMEKVERTKK
ncbi:unnamed protein product [Microthlaspi erraticum]|uniref:F-box domain-containing protein n=1 Tax=Microthlaspi erraticum TaxID=1685480 RepID=A0A6D2J638_9BRAS|nr:unnamed protein product [Microthlaspi erraticum]